MELSSEQREHVLERVRARYRAIGAARLKAIGSNDAVRIINAVRSKRQERLINTSDLPRLLAHENDLVEIAKNPFGPLSDTYATFLCTVTPKDVDKVAPKIAHSFELYER